ncbi:MAG: DUF3990 domain-containing protein [Holophagaceae bacterium]|nr:DUF3990 domain-containing protein [Holophagaceae bacterium]
MLLYHGSNTEVAEPRLMEQTRGLDFGQGFYLTSREGQARGFSERVIKRHKKGIATVNVYDYGETGAEQTLDIKLFPEPNAEWLAFVRDNRLKTYSGKQYDLIIGPVANDNVFLTIQALVIGQFTIEAALVALKSYKLFDQYCFATEKALSMLRFVRSVTILEER